MYDLILRFWRAIVILSSPIVLFFLVTAIYDTVVYAVRGLYDSDYWFYVMFWTSLVLALFFKWLWRVAEVDDHKKPPSPVA